MVDGNVLLVTKIPGMRFLFRVLRKRLSMLKGKAPKEHKLNSSGPQFQNRTKNAYFWTDNFHTLLIVMQIGRKTNPMVVCMIIH